jgi:membrane associated rhomboid family serine protease
MIEFVPIPAIIIISLIIAVWRKAYLSQMFVIANFIIFIYQFAADASDFALSQRLYDYQTFVPANFGRIEYLPSLITSMFMHANAFHLLGNMLILYLLGLPLEERIGTRNWGIVYFVTGIVATLCFYLLHMDSEAHLLGASGAIFGIGGAFLILYPYDRIPMILGFFFTTRAPVWLAVGIMFAIETVLVMISIDDGVAHIAHIGGIVSGIIIAPLIVKKKEKKEVILDFDVLRTMTIKEGDLAMVEKIENEDEDEVREAWLDYFFKNVARCPKCKRHVERASVIECECGQVTKITK